MSARSFPVFHVDAFTERPLCGNPAVVVLNADALSPDDMRRLANELHRGDTAFVLKPEARENDLRLRFFTPKREVPFIGHCTLAAHFALGIDDDDRPARVRQETGAGVVDVAVNGKGAARIVAMSLAPPTLGRVLEDRERSQVLDALGLSSTDLDAACPMQIALKGGARLLIALQSIRRVDALKPDLVALRLLSPRIGADGFFVFARAGAADDCLTESRMFCPAIGIDEDPVSGNAHGMLAVYLFSRGLLTGAGAPLRFSGLQGRTLGRPGRVDVELSASGTSVTGVTIAGHAALVYRTTVSI